MSASSKKKLRKEQEAAKLTEKQLTARKEAKKTNLYTISFVVVMVILLVVAVVVGTNQTIASSGIREKKTVALTVGEHEISSAELSYFYIDAVNEFYQAYGSYASMFGLDVTKPLNEQVVNPETGATWADDFLANAKSSAQTAYALADAAKAAGYTISDDSMTALDAELKNLDTYALVYGFASGEDYLKAMYGRGATAKTYRAYMELRTLASEYQVHYTESLTYDDAALRKAESENYSAYSSFSFNTYYLPISQFLEGGTVGEDGTTTYSDAERAAAVTAAEAAAKTLVDGKPASVAELNAAIAALPVNAGTSATSTAYDNTLYSSISTLYADWVSNKARKEGDVTYVPSTSVTANEDGTETTVTNGYYVVYFVGSRDNTFALKNVRHILVPFEGGTTDTTTGTTTYSDAEKAAAKATAEGILADWKAGTATEDSFAALATEKSTDTGSTANGGLYEDVYPNQMVEPFETWCYAEGRKTGDTGLVESTYGYHIMYFVGDSSLNYRDYLISNALRSADSQTWYEGLIAAMPVADGNLAYIPMDMAINAA